jgi:hypothetical protein
MQETFEIETGFIKWAQSVGFIGPDFQEVAKEESGDVYFVP